jgi:hypothetical protein
MVQCAGATWRLEHASALALALDVPIAPAWPLGSQVQVVQEKAGWEVALTHAAMEELYE